VISLQHLRRVIGLYSIINVIHRKQQYKKEKNKEENS